MRNAMGMVCSGARPRSSRGTSPVCWRCRAGTERREGPGLAPAAARGWESSEPQLPQAFIPWKRWADAGKAPPHIHTGFRELPRPGAQCHRCQPGVPRSGPCGGRPSVPGGGTGSGRSQPALPGCAGTRRAPRPPEHLSLPGVHAGHHRDPQAQRVSPLQSRHTNPPRLTVPRVPTGPCGRPPPTGTAPLPLCGQHGPAWPCQGPSWLPLSPFLLGHHP